MIRRLLLVLVLSMVCLGDASIPRVFGAQAGHPAPPSNMPSGRIIKVVDGDTADVTLNGRTERIRMIGIDTPETKDPRKPVQCFGREASDRASALLDGKMVRIETDASQDTRDKYDRLLAYVWLPDGKLFNLEMVAGGYAHEHTYDAAYEYQADFKQAESAATAAGRGLWAASTCNGDTEQAAVNRAPAQQDQRCFPETGQCISGRFRQYWEQNGGLAVFGFPLSSVMGQEADDGMFETQQFERNSFELHPENQPPYDVLLGRLGDDRLKQLGRDWLAEPKGTQQPNCAWFADTSHNVCEPFRSYWQNHGLQDPALNAYGKSLALFGFPLTEASIETNAAGATVITQWFERARFECHPNNPPEYQVLLGLLGKEILDRPAIPAAGAPVQCTVTAPAPTAQPTAAPQPTARPTTVPQPPAPQPTARPAPTSPPPTANCDPSYPDFCIPPPPPDLDCPDIGRKPFTVIGRDPHRFDADNDGIGCES